MSKIVDFVLPLDMNNRIRHYHRVNRGRIEQFVIQYETKLQLKWLVVVRYDTAHGFAHRDLMHVDGRTDKLSLGTLNFNDALTFAENDIKNNWSKYRANYFKEF